MTISSSAPIRRVRIPVFEEQERLVSEAIRNRHFMVGPHLGRLEAELASRFQKRYVVLTANAYSALFVTLRAQGVTKGEVVTAAASTCFAGVNAVLAAGGQVRFVDMDFGSAGVSDVGRELEGRPMLIPDHFGRLSPVVCHPRTHSGFLIEDAAQAFISRAATPAEADAVILSFYPTKLVNGIDGGALLTDDVGLYERAKSLTTYSDQFEYRATPRYNLRLSNLHAAFVLGTLAHIDEVSLRLNSLQATMGDALKERGMDFLEPGRAEVASSFVLFAPDRATRDRWIESLGAQGVEAHWALMHLCPPDEAGQYPVAQALVERALSVPYHPLLSEEEVDAVLSGIRGLS